MKGFIELNTYQKNGNSKKIPFKCKDTHNTIKCKGYTCVLVKVGDNSLEGIDIIESQEKIKKLIQQAQEK